MSTSIKENQPMSFMRHAFRAGLVFAVLAPLTSLYGQSSNSTIKGTVTDPTDAAITGAVVDLTNSGTGEHRQGRTKQSGDYDFAALPPGDYVVKASAPGFADWTGQLTLRVGQ